MSIGGRPQMPAPHREWPASSFAFPAPSSFSFVPGAADLGVGNFAASPSVASAPEESAAQAPAPEPTAEAPAPATDGRAGDGPNAESWGESGAPSDSDQESTGGIFVCLAKPALQFRRAPLLSARDDDRLVSGGGREDAGGRGARGRGGTSHLCTHRRMMHVFLFCVHVEGC